MGEPDMTEEEKWDFDELERIAKKTVSWRRQMVARNLARARAKCPTCQQPEKMVVYCNIEGNQHIRCHCEFCGANFMQ